MKRFIVTFLLAFISQGLQAQIVTDTIHSLFKRELDGDAIREKFTSGGKEYWDTKKRVYVYLPWLYAFISKNLIITKELPHEKITEINLFRKDSNFIRERSIHSIFTAFDSNAVIFTSYLINQKNSELYEFRILKNKEDEILSWSPIRLFCEPYVGYTAINGVDEEEIAYLGEFKTELGNNLTVDLRRKGRSEILSSITVLWIQARPEILGVFTYKQFPDFLKVFKRYSEYEIRIQHTPNERKTKDSLLTLKRNFESDENTLMFFLDNKIRSKEIVEYQLVGPGKTTEWKPNVLDVNLIWLKDLPPGKYKLRLRYSIQRHNVTEYEFEIKPAWQQTTTFKIITGSLIAAFFGFILLLLINKNQKRKLKNEQLNRRMVEIELKSIRSQLNPHFIFNSLNSIQSLVTKNDPEAVNKYLTRFSNLVRKALIASDHEFIPLREELATIENYMSLEKLRFGFKFSIKVNDDVNPSETDIPSLLLQPLIENAVKHGISGKQETGEIDILIKKENKDLFIIISDNGRGFEISNTFQGYGLKLTKTRIELLNSILKENTINMKLSSDPANGTVVHLLFTNWF